MSLRIRQIVFATRDLGTTVERLERVLGLQVAYRDPLVDAFGLENALLPVGDQFIEVVAPIRDNTAAGRHLERHGDSAYMLILQTDDIVRDRARLQRLGARTIWQADYPDVRATQIHPKDIGAAIVSLDQPVPPESWRWAGPNWQEHVSNSGARARCICEAVIMARDPAAMAQRWSQVLGVDAPASNEAGRTIALTDSTLHFATSDADVIGGYRFTMSDPSAAFAAARALQLPVAEGAVTICGTRLRLD